MELKNSEAAALANSSDVGASSSDELDLYNELSAFASLTPEQRRIQADLSSKPKREPVAESVSTGALPLQPAAEQISAPARVPDTSVRHDGNSTNRSEARAASPGPFAGLGDSGSLAGLSPESPFTGALTRGVCLACGAESGVNDLFCITCGAFVDEAETPVLSIPTCTQCGLGIPAGEAFCPRCGVLPPGF
jgi:hypothetical protein